MPRQTKPLTDTEIRTAKAKDKPYKLFDGGGLYILITTTATPIGGKLWRMKYTRPSDGKEDKLAFGVYPDVSLLEAREKRKQARELLAQGKDPKSEKRAEETAKREDLANTFEKIAREWHQGKLSGWQDNTARDILNRLEKDIFPALGALPIRTIKHKQLIDTLRRIEERGANEIAKRLKANCERIWSYAIVHGYAEQNIAKDLVDILQPVRKGHFAAIGSDELPEFLRVFDRNEARAYPPTRIAFQLMMLLFIRTSELIETPWEEIDFENRKWVIPWQRMKMGKRKINPDTNDHEVFPQRQAWDLLRELRRYTGGSEWLFPNKRDPKKPMSNGAILMLLRRMGYKGKMTGHGFRSLAASAMSENLKGRSEAIHAQLAHKPKDKIHAAYFRSSYDDERRALMQEWADYLDKLKLKAGAEVIPLRA